MQLSPTAGICGFGVAAFSVLLNLPCNDISHQWHLAAEDYTSLQGDACCLSWILNGQVGSLVDILNQSLTYMCRVPFQHVDFLCKNCSLLQIIYTNNCHNFQQMFGASLCFSFVNNDYLNSLSICFIFPAH